MDKEKIPERILSQDATVDKLEIKHANFFREPEGMTTICLNDTPIPNEKKRIEKFKFNHGIRKYTKLLWALAGAVFVTLLFVVYEKQGINSFENTFSVQSNKICQENANSSTNSTTGHKNTTTTTTIEETSTSAYKTRINSISGSLMINPQFVGVAAASSKSSDDGPSDIIDLLNVFGYILDSGKLERERRSIQADNAVAVIAPPPKVTENCTENETDKNLTDSRSINNTESLKFATNKEVLKQTENEKFQVHVASENEKQRSFPSKHKVEMRNQISTAESLVKSTSFFSTTTDKNRIVEDNFNVNKSGYTSARHSTVKENNKPPLFSTERFSSTVSVLANKTNDNATSLEKPVNFEYFENSEGDTDGDDSIAEPYIPIETKKVTTKQTTTSKPDIESDYTADPYEQEKNVTNYSSTVTEIKTVLSTKPVSNNSTEPVIKEANVANVSSSLQENKTRERTAQNTNFENTVVATAKTTPLVTFGSSTTNVPSILTEITITTPSKITSLSTISETITNSKELLASKGFNKNLLPITETNLLGATAEISTAPSKSQDFILQQQQKDGDIFREKPSPTIKQKPNAQLVENWQSNNPLQCVPPMGYQFPPPQFYPPQYYPSQYYPPPFPSNPFQNTFQKKGELQIVNVPFSNKAGQIVILNPPVVNSAPPYMTLPQNFPPLGTSFSSFSQLNSLQSVDSNGQYYVCKPIPSPSTRIINNVPELEFRKEFNQEFATRTRTFSYATPIECPNEHVKCSDNSKCIKQKHICDGESDCKDGSDESNCTCNDRLDAFRICDGYIDCPEGEDEVGCFGCSKYEFSCNDWNPRYRRSTCIPLAQRCDGIEHCPAGYDEIDCTVLTDTLEEHKLIKVSNAVGFLNRNYKGKWYPTCFGTEIWAAEVCKTESGPNPHHLIPERHLIKAQDYKGPYLEETEDEGLHLKEKCDIEGSATFIRCPPLICGMRLKIRNPYRVQEVETSNEILEERPPDQLPSDDILGDSRIVGGDGSQPASWPWVVTIYKNGIFHCSGVIINELWIISAAHCINKYWLYYYEVQAGVLRRFSFSPQTQRRWVTHAIPYPSYNKSTLQHDISLLKLSAPLRYNRYVRPICLPSEATAGTDYFNAPYPGTECTVVGWGATAEHSADPDHLREVRVPVLPVCKYEEDRETNAICAGFSEGGKDACQGDSGGPFMCLNPNHPHQWYLAGIVSHGEGCARAEEPGIYTRVSLYVEWILEYVNAQERLPPQMPLQECPGYVCRETNTCISKKSHCDKIVDCLHGDDELNCNRWKIDDYLRHMEFVVDGSDSESMLESDEDDDNRNLRVGESINSRLQSILNENTRFTCKKLLQHIPYNKRCNRITDCEDGTDEVGCTCKDYLVNAHLGAICDGVTDCADLSDEKDCNPCKSGEYYCRLSQSCILLKNRCDGTADCLYQEDEWDCMALSNGTVISLDADERPELRTSGIVASNYRGNWKVACISQRETETQARIAATVCSYLGFNDYYKFKVFSSKRLRSSILTPLSNYSSFVPIKENDNCSLFYVKCSREITHPKMEHVTAIAGKLEDQFYSPWIARIHSDGNYQCAGVLIDLSWVLTSSNCFQHKLLKQSFLTALLGTGKGNLQVQGPYEQIIPISKFQIIRNSSLVLLKLHSPATHTRYVRPINLNLRVDANRERCMASEADNHGTIKTVILKSSTRKCKSGFKCYSRKTPMNTTCESEPWAGVIVCESGRGWYPSALYFERKGYCGFNNVTKYPAISTMLRTIIEVINNGSKNTRFQECDGFRCKLGQCIKHEKTCDGVPDCRNAEDEEESYCSKIKQSCNDFKNCTCSKWEMKCGDGSCLSKTYFCDGTSDCEDGSDEPVKCTCREYLKLSEPSKICDGVVHCRDSSDERFCPCNESNFKCARSSTCVANATVCDGVYDCPKGEDEENCIALKAFDGTTTSGEVITRTAGIWHSGCFPPKIEPSNIRIICNLLNLEGGKHPKQLKPDKPETTERAVYDRFSVVHISRRKSHTVWLKIRSGFDEMPIMFVKICQYNICCCSWWFL